MEEGDSFASKVTGERHKIRQQKNCESKNVVYLVECKKCGEQRVGSTEDFKPISFNYISDIFLKRATCFNLLHTGGGGVFHLQASKLLRTPKQNKPSPSNVVTFPE